MCGQDVRCTFEALFPAGRFPAVVDLRTPLAGPAVVVFAAGAFATPVFLALGVGGIVIEWDAVARPFLICA